MTFDRRRLNSFARNESGNITMMFGLMGMTMFLCMGTAIDYARWLHAKEQTKQAMDAAVLAGGRALQLNNTDTEHAISVARNYYERNKSTRLDLVEDTIDFTTADAGKSIVATGNAEIQTTILALAGINEMPLLDLSGADYSKAEIAVGGNADVNLEISLMLDITGSMAGTKITDMQEAAKDLIDIVVWDDQSQKTSRVALVPFSQAVNLGGTYFEKVTNKQTNSELAGNTAPVAETKAVQLAFIERSQSALVGFWNALSPVSTAHAKDKDKDKDKKKKDDDDDDDKDKDTDKNTNNSAQTYDPCAVDRTGNDALTDAAPGPGTYVQAYDIAKNSNDHTRDMSCRPSEITVMPLTSNKTALKAKIDTFVADGWTAGSVGTAFAWYMLSPKWSAVWGQASAPAAYDDTQTRKIAILMTDGEYNTWYNGNGNGTASEQAVSLCAGMKAQGITVYTVGFDLGGNQTAIDTLSACATTAGHAYVADDGEQLKQAFRDIALKMSDLYLSK